MNGSRVLSFDKDLHKLPVGAAVVNGHPWAKEYVFEKVAGGLWKLINPEKPETDPHANLTRARPEWGAEDGFKELNLPVYLLSKSGNREEVLQSLNQWRAV